MGAFPKKISASKTCKIWGDFGQLQTLITNISGMYQDIKNWKSKWLTVITPTFSEKVRWTLVHQQQSCTCEFGPTQVNFFGPWGVLQPQIFTYTRQWPSLASIPHRCDFGQLDFRNGSRYRQLEIGDPWSLLRFRKSVNFGPLTTRFRRLMFSSPKFNFVHAACANALATCTLAVCTRWISNP